MCDYGCGAVLEKCNDAGGDKDHNCDICGAENVSEHNWVDATCTAPKTCSECGATDGDVLDHPDENKDHKCDNNCGKTDIGTHADSAEDADHVCDYGCGVKLEECSDAKSDKDHNCDICGAENVSEHNWIDATCTAPKTCSECGATEGEKLGHTEEIIPCKEPTLTESGLTEGKKCSVCRLILVEQEEIPALEFISGKCGIELIWTLSNDGVLTISGTGGMFDFKIILENLPLSIAPMNDKSELDLDVAPWSDYTDLIITVVVEDGVTSIGDNAFAYCEKLTEVKIPETVTEIGNGAFSGCEALEEIVYAGSKAQWEKIEVGTGNDVAEKDLVTCAILMGDVTGDGVVDVGDAVKLLKAIASKTTDEFSDEVFEAADVTRDGVIDVGDAVKLLKAIASKTTDKL